MTTGRCILVFLLGRLTLLTRSEWTELRPAKDWVRAGKVTQSIPDLRLFERHYQGTCLWIRSRTLQSVA